MSFSIIPPILIIASLAGIIFFLIKKSDKVANLSLEEIRQEEEERKMTMEEAGIFKKISLKITGIKWESVKHFLLVSLEKLTSKLRVLFLKLESKFGDLSTSIRNRRKARLENRAVKPAENSEDDILRKLREYKNEQPIKQKIKTEKAEPSKFVSAVQSMKDEDGKIIKPIISEKVARPQKAEMKDRLEELLIERIAVNPKDIEAYERLGQYYMEIRSYKDAKECFKQVIKLDSGNRTAKYRLKRLETLLTK